MDITSRQCAKDCGPHNNACKYGHERFRGSQFLAHAVIGISFVGETEWRNAVMLAQDNQCWRNCALIQKVGEIDLMSTGEGVRECVCVRNLSDKGKSLHTH